MNKELPEALLIPDGGPFLGVQKGADHRSESSYEKGSN
jgi:hypothetical protein